MGEVQEEIISLQDLKSDLAELVENQEYIFPSESVEGKIFKKNLYSFYLPTLF